MCGIKFVVGGFFMVGIYLSGTGNTEHCVKMFVNNVCDDPKVIPVEHTESVEYLRNEKEIVLGYPTQFSNAPKMIRDFVEDNRDLWKGKEVFIIVTMGAFSGDGSGCTARKIRKYGGIIKGALQIKMPDSVCDSKLLKKSYKQNAEIEKRADQKLQGAIASIRSGIYPKEGLSGLSHIIGLFGQRLWYLNKYKNYSNELKISDTCKACGLCVKECPMHNLILKEGHLKPEQLGRCTMCYRCISSCPQKAITLLGKEVIEQTRYEKLCG